MKALARFNAWKRDIRNEFYLFVLVWSAALLLACMYACRVPDRWHAGVTQYNMDGTRTTSAGPLAGRSTAESDGDGVALTIGVDGGIGTSKTEEALERIAEAQERANLMREHEALKAEVAPPPQKETALPAQTDTSAVAAEPTTPPHDSPPEPFSWPVAFKIAGPSLLIIIATALTGKHEKHA